MKFKWFQQFFLILFLIGICAIFWLSFSVIETSYRILFLVYAIILFLSLIFIFFTKNYIQDKKTPTKIQLNPIMRIILIIPLIFLLDFNINYKFFTYSPFLILICYSFLPGIIIIDLFQISKNFSLIENLFLSYIISYFCTSIIWFILLPLNNTIRSSILIGIYISIGIVNLIINRKKTESIIYRKSFFSKYDLIILGLISGIFLIFSYVLYPNLVYLVDSDVARHFRQSLLLLNNPNNYSFLNYLFSNLYESAAISMYANTISNALLLFQSTHYILNMFLPISCYCLLKRMVEYRNTVLNPSMKKIPIIGTFIWTLLSPSFSGFGIIFIFFQKILDPTTSFITIVNSSYRYINYGSSYGFYGFTYLPLHTNIFLMIILLWLISCKEVSSKVQNILFFVISLSIYLTHMSEGVFFGLFICFYYLVNSEKIELKSLVISGALASLTTIFLYLYVFITRCFKGLYYDSTFYSICATFLCFVCVLFIKNIRYCDIIINKLKEILVKYDLINRILPYFVWFIAIGFITWFSLLENYDFNQIPDLTIPWYGYSLIGFPLILAIFGFFAINNSNNSFNAKLLIQFTIFTVLLGRFLTYSKIYLFDIGYWEFRFGSFINIGLCLSAALSLLIFYNKRKMIKSSQMKSILFVSLLSSLFLIGFLSNTLSVATFNQFSKDPNSQQYKENIISNLELGLLNDLKLDLIRDPNAWVSTLDYSQHVLNLAGPSFIQCAYELFALKSPEASFKYAYVSEPFTHPFIYMNNIRDSHVLVADYYSQYYSLYLTEYTKYIPIIYQDGMNHIYNGNKLSFPLKNSNTTLANSLNMNYTHFERFQRYFCPILLSDSMINYTTQYIEDPNLFDSETLILSFDPYDNATLKILEEFSNSNKKIIIINTNGYNLIGNKLLNVSQENCFIDTVQYPDKSYYLERNNEIQSCQLKDNSINVSSYYSAGNQKLVPCMLETKFNNSTLFYLNIFPVLDLSRTLFTYPPILEAFRPICNYLQLNEINQKALTKDSSDYIKEIILENASLCSDSILLPTNLTYNFEINFQNETKLFFTNSAITSLGKNQKELRINETKLEQDYSFYTKIVPKNPFEIDFLESDEISFSFLNNIYHLKDVSSLIISPNSSMNCYIRTPNILSNRGIFNYILLNTQIDQSLNPLLKFRQQNIEINDNLTFTVDVSDSFFEISNILFANFLHINYTKSSFDQITPIKYGIVSGVILSPLILITKNYFRKNKQFYLEFMN